MVGTVQEVETAQLPQSMRPVAESLRQAGWFCGPVPLTIATFRAPIPP